MTGLEKLKELIEEDNYPYFTDTYLQSKLDEIGTKKGITLMAIARELVIIKAGIQEIKIGDVTIPSPRDHFLRLAQQYRGGGKGGTRVVTRADEQ